MPPLVFKLKTGAMKQHDLRSLKTSKLNLKGLHNMPKCEEIPHILGKPPLVLLWKADATKQVQAYMKFMYAHESYASEAHLINLLQIKVTFKFKAFFEWVQRLT